MCFGPVEDDKMQSLQGYDPLGDIGAERSVDQIVIEAQKRDIVNILRSYTGTLDVLNEAIQNALDAVELKSRAEASYTPRITIEIDTEKSHIRIIDNGIGMTSEQIKYFLRPSYSFKVDQRLRGHKGVGATFLAYGYTAFVVQTRHADGEVAVSLSGGRQWAESTTNNIPRPTFSELKFCVPELNGEDSGTSVEISIGQHRDERPNLSWLNITDPEVWLKVLRIRTPLGGVYIKSGGIKPNYRIVVIGALGRKEVESSADDAEFMYPHYFRACQRNADVNDISKKVTEMSLTKAQMASKLPANLRNLDCIWNVWGKDEILSQEGAFFDDLSDEQRALIVRHDVHIYGCFVRSRTVWETFQKDETGIRTQFRVIQGGLQLASDHMIQGELFTIPLTTAAGYQANAFIIVHFTNGNPDMGRKVFQPELKELADVLSRRVVSELRKYQSLLKPDSGSSPSSPSKELDEWRDDQRDWAKINPLHLRIDGKAVALMSLPREEQDVIALFHELVGMGFIKGLFFYGTGYNSRYDGLFFYKYSDDHVFDSKKCFFGVDPSHANRESGALVLEYKYSMDGLIRDFDKEEKSVREINFLVCWDIGSEYRRGFEVASLLVGQEGGTRDYFGSTHSVFMGSGRSMKIMEVVCLKDLIEYHQDPVALIAAHQAAFG